MKLLRYSVIGLGLAVCLFGARNAVANDENRATSRRKPRPTISPK